MSFQMIASDLKAPNNGTLRDGVPRRTANFQPSPWGDYFFSCHSNIPEEADMVSKKQEVRTMLTAAEKYSEKLCLIDSIQRLGLSYHFEHEIHQILKHIQNSPDIDEKDEDLYITALSFRLLRQQGFFVSCEIFNKFTNKNGDFKESILKDKSGILSLYEASHLRIKGEKILDEALAFTTTQLEAMAMDSNSPFSEEAKYALKWPIVKAVPRFMTRHYISLYSNNPLKNSALLTFAKLDYNSLQQLYRKELAEFSRWWKDLELRKQLSFARDRVTECYIMALGIYYEPKHSLARIILAKVATILTTVDDMYDVYATLDELQLFTDAIQRWDVNCIEKLPNYMKVLYEAILEYYGEIEQVICKENNTPFAFDYAKEMMKRQCKAYLMEAKWFNEGYIPTMEECMEVSTTSSAIYASASIFFLVLGNVASKEVFEWAQTDPVLLKACGIIGKLVNDIASHKIEQERGDVASAVECYMKEFGVSEEDAVGELKKQVVKAWKDVIEDYMESSKLFPNVILEPVLNYCRVSELFYKEGDGYTFADGETKRFIALMLADPVPI